jgi:hypothetical protein
VSAGFRPAGRLPICAAAAAPDLFTGLTDGIDLVPDGSTLLSMLDAPRRRQSGL